MSDIFVIAINYGPNGAVENFFYKSRLVAQKQLDEFGHLDGYTLVDDFGTEGRVVGEVHSVRLYSMEKAMDLQVENSIMQAKGQAKLQRRSAADPELKFGANIAPFARA